MLQYLIFLAYIGSLGLAFEIAPSFAVLGAGETLIVGLAILAPLFCVYSLFKGSERAGLAAIHLLLAVCFHPEFTFKDPLHLDFGKQTELLLRIHQKGGSLSGQTEMAYNLARSLKADAMLQLKLSRPVRYWAFPPSVALAVWGVIFFFYFPKTNERGNERI